MYSRRRAVPFVDLAGKIYAGSNAGVASEEIETRYIRLRWCQRVENCTGRGIYVQPTGGSERAGASLVFKCIDLRMRTFLAAAQNVHVHRWP